MNGFTLVYLQTPDILDKVKNVQVHTYPKRTRSSCGTIFSVVVLRVARHTSENRYSAASVRSVGQTLASETCSYYAKRVNIALREPFRVFPIGLQVWTKNVLLTSARSGETGRKRLPVCPDVFVFV